MAGIWLPVRGLVGLLRLSHWDVRNRPRAFSIVEWGLYCYAIYAVGQKIRDAAAVSVMSPGAITVSAAIFLVVLLVFARNYVVMHAIDNRDRERNKHNEFHFVDANTGLADVVERVLRAAIVAVVVGTPKNAIPPLSDRLDAMARILSGKAQYYLTLIHDFTATGTPTPKLFDLVAYYGAVLFLVFSLCLLWDLINVVAYAGRDRLAKHRSPPPGTPDPGTTRAALDDILRYMHVDHRWGENGGASEATQKKLAKRDRLISEGRIVRLYFCNTKFRERLAGLLLSVFMIGFSATNAGPETVAGIGGFAVVYIYAAARNENYGLSLLEFALLLVHYLFPRPGPDNATPVIPAPAGEGGR